MSNKNTPKYIFWCNIAKDIFTGFILNMKVNFYTNLQNPVQYSTPIFKAKPQKVNWNSESGQLIEKTLIAIATSAAAAGISISENFKTNKKCLDYEYMHSKDPNILDKHALLYQDAYKNKDILKGGYSNVTEENIDCAIVSIDTINALDIIGRGNLEAAFELDIVGFEQFCSDIAEFKKQVAPKDMEILKKKINPENTKEYRTLEQEVREYKKEISKLLGEENLIKRAELLDKIKVLKNDKSNEKEVKELKHEIQSLYKNCENSSKIANLIQSINKKQIKMKEILNQKVNLSPQEIVNKIWTITSLLSSPKYQNTLYITNFNEFEQYIKKQKDITDKDKIINGVKEDFFKDNWISVEEFNSSTFKRDASKLINFIQPSTPENDNKWNLAVDKLVFEYIGYPYTKDLSEFFEFPKYKYLNQLIISDEYFWNNMRILVDALVYNIASSNSKDESLVEMSLDNMNHNWETRKIYENNKLDYDKWKHFDKNSFIEEKITIKKEDAKNKAVKNMCDELTNIALFKYIPQDIKDSFYNSLKEIGLDVNIKSKKVLLNGRNIEYNDLPKIISVIKKEMNTNRFWLEESAEENIEDSRSTLYNHFMYQRKQEIDNIKRLKEIEEVDIKVQKVDMSDLKHSLSLGNDAHCCTALGGQSNEWSAPAYILTRAIGAIEVLANNEAVGNTMMYVAKVNGKLSLILDDIELQTKYQNNDKIRDMITKYAKQVCKEIGKEDMHIYAGPGLHKVNMSGYELINKANMKILGKTCSGVGVYLDFDGLAHNLDGKSIKTDLYKIA